MGGGGNGMGGWAVDMQGHGGKGSGLGVWGDGQGVLGRAQNPPAVLGLWVGGWSWVGRCYAEQEPTPGIRVEDSQAASGSGIGCGG